MVVTVVIALWRAWWVRCKLLALAVPDAPDQQARLHLPPVSIIVPARDEAANIGACLDTLRAQTDADYEIIVVDDASTDDTAAIVQRRVASDARLRLVRVEKLPGGWAGKAHALHTGVAAARPQSRWLLFTDADTRHQPTTLATLLSHACAHNLDMLTLAAANPVRTFSWCLLMPLGDQLTTETMPNPDSTRATAHGHYMLLRRAIYEVSGGYAAIPTTTADDVDLAQLLKKQGARIGWVDSTGFVSAAQWATLPTLWRGWRKSIYGAVGGNPLVLAAAGFSFAAYGVMPLVGLILGIKKRNGWIVAWNGAAWVGQAAGRRPIDRRNNVSIFWSATAPVGWIGVGLIFLDAARLALLKRGAAWKGRAIARPNTGRG